MKTGEKMVDCQVELPFRYFYCTLHNYAVTDDTNNRDHAVTATQKTILSGFRMDARSVKNRDNELSELLVGIEE